MRGCEAVVFAGILGLESELTLGGGGCVNVDFAARLAGTVGAGTSGAFLLFPPS